MFIFLLRWVTYLETKKNNGKTQLSTYTQDWNCHWIEQGSQDYQKAIACQAS